MENVWKVKAVIFDWAGTSVDYGCMAPARVFVDVLAGFGISISLQEARGPMGLAKRDHVRELFRLNSLKEQWFDVYGHLPGNTDEEKVYEQAELAMADIAAEYAKPVPGMVELAEQLKQKGTRIGSTTGYVKNIMDEVVKAAAYYDYIPDAVVSSSDVSRGRPAPYMCYLNAMALDVFPMSAMIKVGDTVADIQEGRNAGMWTIGVTKSGNGVGFSEEEIENVFKPELSRRINETTDRLKNAGAHYIVDGVWDSMSVIEEISDRISKGEIPV